MISRIANLLLLGVFPVAWMAPLARAENKWLFISEEISIVSAVVQLYDSDIFLCVVLALFAFVMPYLKTLLLVYAQFSDTETARRMMPALEFMGRLSMTDVFLIALYVVVYRGIGEIVIDWGLYLFTAAVLVSILASWDTQRRLSRRIRAERRGEPYAAGGAETRAVG